MSARDHSIDRELDTLPVTRVHVAILCLCALGLAFDLYEIGLGSAFGAVFSKPPHLATPQALSWLLSSVYVGAILGASLGGWLADRMGRQRVMVWMLWLLAVTAGLSAAATDVDWLTATRMMMGLTLGAFPPLLTAYLTDILPRAQRGRLVFITMALAFLGAPAGVFFIRWMTPLDVLGLAGWRWSLILGAAGAAGCALAFRFLPESPRWLSAVGRPGEALVQLARMRQSPTVLRSPPESPTVGGTQLAGPPAASTSRRFVLYSGLCFLLPWSTAAFPLLTGAILMHKGFQLSDTLLYVGLSTFGPVIGTLLAATVIDKVGRRSAIAGCFGVMLACGLGFAISEQPVWLVATSLLFSMCGAVTVPMLNVYGSELFATRVRGSAVTGAWAFNRLGAALAPLLLLPLMQYGGVPIMMVAMAATLLLAVVLLAVAPPGRPRQAVD